MEESVFVRTAVTACSSIATTPGACSIRQSSPSSPARRSAALTASRSPTSTGEMPDVRRAWTAPSTISSGAKSPPIASSAMGAAAWDTELPLDVEVSDGSRPVEDEMSSLGHVGAHQPREHRVGVLFVLHAHAQACVGSRGSWWCPTTGRRSSRRDLCTAARPPCPTFASEIASRSSSP